MVHPVEGLEGACLRRLTLLNERFQVIEGLRDDREVAVLEEERNDAFLHVGALLGCLFLQVFIDERRCVTHLLELRSHGFRLSCQLVALHDDFTLRVHLFTDLLAPHAVLPPVEEIPLPVLSHVHQHPSKELLFIVSLLSPHSHVMEGRSQSTLHQAVENVADGAVTMLLVLVLSRLQTDRLLLPVLESLCLVKVLHSIDHT